MQKCKQMQGHMEEGSGWGSDAPWAEAWRIVKGDAFSKAELARPSSVFGTRYLGNQHVGIPHGESAWGFPMGDPREECPWGFPMGNPHGDSSWGIPLGFPMGNPQGKYLWEIPMGNFHGEPL